MLLEIRRLDEKMAEAALPQLAAILVDAVANGASVNFLAGFSQAEGEAFWRGQIEGIASGGRILLVAEQAGELVGTVVLTLAPQPNGPHRAEIGKMLVHSSARRRGLGSRLLIAAEQVAREQGRTLLHLDTQTGSAGEALYRAHGWTLMGVMPGHSMTPDGTISSASFFYKQVAP
jgi:GNAT superfamily N-acetyltransferase